jgi:hypothetical protein
LPWLGFDHSSQTDRFFKGSIRGSTDWMVLHRPFEPAAQTGQVEMLADLWTRELAQPRNAQRAEHIESFTA